MGAATTPQLTLFSISSLYCSKIFESEKKKIYLVQCLKFTSEETKTQWNKMICLNFTTQVVVEEADGQYFCFQGDHISVGKGPGRRKHKH